MRNKEQSLNYRSKIKLGFGLVVLMILLIVANKFEENNLAQIDQSFTSIYEDRLVPATSIFDIREQLYRKREILERMLHSANKSLDACGRSIHACNKNIADLLAAYKQTYFLDEETDFLLQFETDLTHYNILEAKILQKLGQEDLRGASTIFEEEMVIIFDDAATQLSNLNHIQLEIGKDLMSGEKTAGASLKMLFHLETGLILLIALIFYLLIQKSVISKGNPVDYYHLN